MISSKKKILIPVILLCGTAVFLLLRPPYLVKQGFFLFKYYLSAEKISSLQKKGHLSKKEKQLFQRIDQIKKHAINNFGLRDNDNYTRYVKIERHFINYVLSAADPLSLKPERWHFPLFGSFPYLGFFTEDDAKKEASILKAKGLDVYLRTSAAFSTLGILSDPVYSYFARYSHFSLARLIIHEQTHAILYLDDHVQFNEELATFTGRVGGLHYLAATAGRESADYRNALRQIDTTEAIYVFFRQFHEELSALYSSSLSKEKMLKKKEKLFAASKKKFLRRFQGRLSEKSYQWYTRNEWNNAFVLSFIRYGRDLSLFYRLYRKEGKNLKKMLETLKILEKIEESPKTWIKRNLLHE